MINTTDDTTPLAVLDTADCACWNMRKAARVVTQIYDAALQPAGLKATQFSVLAVLAKRGDLPLTRLAEILVLDRTTLTRNLGPLLAKGWIAKETEEDQRVRRLRLTEAGRGVFVVALPHWENAQSRLVKRLGADRWANLLDDLGAAIAVAKDG